MTKIHKYLEALGFTYKRSYDGMPGELVHDYFKVDDRITIFVNKDIYQVHITVDNKFYNELYTSEDYCIGRFKRLYDE